MIKKLLGYINVHPDENQSWLLVSLVISGLLITYAHPTLVKEIISNLPAQWIAFESLAASIVIAVLWDENELQLKKSEDTKEQLKNAMKEFNKMEVLCIGLIEGIAMACLNIYLFSWTPILTQSTPGGMNVGFIFTSMVLTMIVGTKSYEVLISHDVGMVHNC